MAESICACGREAVDVLRVASEDGLLLIPVCAECIEDPAVGEQRELFGPDSRRPLTTMPSREDDDAQEQLPLGDASNDERGAA